MSALAITGTGLPCRRAWAAISSARRHADIEGARDQAGGVREVHAVVQRRQRALGQPVDACGAGVLGQARDGRNCEDLGQAPLPRIQRGGLLVEQVQPTDDLSVRSPTSTEPPMR